MDGTVRKMGLMMKKKKMKKKLKIGPPHLLWISWTALKATKWCLLKILPSLPLRLMRKIPQKLRSLERSKKVMTKVTKKTILVKMVPKRVQHRKEIRTRTR